MTDRELMVLVNKWFDENRWLFNPECRGLDTEMDLFQFAKLIRDCVKDEEHKSKLACLLGKNIVQ